MKDPNIKVAAISYKWVETTGFSTRYETCSVWGSHIQCSGRLTNIQHLPRKTKQQQKPLRSLFLNFPNQDNSVHACKLFLTWMISVICCAPVGSCVSLGADVLWCTGGNEVLCKGLGTSLSGIAIQSLPFVQLQLWGLAPWCMPSSKAGLFPAFQWKYLGYTRKTNKKPTTKATHQPKQKINKPTLFSCFTSFHSSACCHRVDEGMDAVEMSLLNQLCCRRGWTQDHIVLLYIFTCIYNSPSCYVQSCAVRVKEGVFCSFGLT